LASDLVRRKLNGLRLSRTSPRLNDIGIRRRDRRDSGLPKPFFDHCIFFRSAIITQPYVCPPESEWRFLAEHRLTVSFPPNPKASFYAPGSCFIAAVHKPGLVVSWLPEQLG
jgi:hypothetical protein